MGPGEYPAKRELCDFGGGVMGHETLMWDLRGCSSANSRPIRERESSSCTRHVPRRLNAQSVTGRT